MNGRKQFLRGERGTTLVEAALSATLLIGIIFGVIAGGYMLYTYHFLSYAARSGARYAMVRGSACSGVGMPDCPNVTSDQVQTYVRGLRQLGINPSQLTVTTTWPNGTKTDIGNEPRNPVNVTVSYPFLFFVPVPFIKSQTVTMQSTSQMVISQ
jgi:Flp pilus assembly protein TadG